FNTKEVTKVCFFENLVVFFSNSVFADVYLDLTITVLDMSKSNFTLTTLSHESPSDNSCLVNIVKLFFGLVCVFVFELARSSCAFKAFTERINPLFSQMCHFFTTHDLLVI